MLLRRVALGLLDDLLMPEPKRRPHLSQLCTGTDAATLTWWWSTEPANRARVAFALPPINGSPLRLPPVRSELLAPWWNLAATRAWGDLEFGRTVADRVGRWTLERRLAWPDLPETPVFSPRTWAVLCCLAYAGEPLAPPRRTFWNRLWRALRALLRIRNHDTPQPDLPAAWRRAQGILTLLVMEERWAGYWDRWLIGRALARWPSAGAEAPPELRNACAPLATVAGEWAAPPEGVADLSRRDWARQRPAFMSGAASFAG